LRDCGAQHTDFAAKDQTGTELSIPFAPPSDALDLNPASPFWRRDHHAGRRPRLLARSRALSALRRRFEGEGFVEVEPAALQVSPGNETHLHGFATSLIGPDGRSHVAYLHTSPEFSMKKLLAAGEQRIASLGHVWRNRERTATHHPEFTMLEWYRPGAGMGSGQAGLAA